VVAAGDIWAVVIAVICKVAKAARRAGDIVVIIYVSVRLNIVKVV
jgi:hypothetical protein